MAPSAALVVGAFAVVATALSRPATGRAATAPAAALLDSVSMGALPPGAAGSAEGPAPRLRTGELAGGCSFVEPPKDALPVVAELRYQGAHVVVSMPRALDLAEPAPWVLHFHGAEAARRAIGQAGLPVVLVAVDAGARSSPYRDLAQKASGRLAAELVEEAQKGLRAALGKAPPVGQRLVSSWSAGYAAVLGVASREGSSIDGVALVDSLYSDLKDGAADPAPLEPLLARAARAADGGPPFFLSYGDVRTRGYASTRETAALVLSRAGLDASTALPLRSGGELREREHLAVYYLPGDGGEDHCNHLRLLPSALRDWLLRSGP